MGDWLSCKGCVQGDGRARFVGNVIIGTTSTASAGLSIDNSVIEEGQTRTFLKISTPAGACHMRFARGGVASDETLDITKNFWRTNGESFTVEDVNTGSHSIGFNTSGGFNFATSGVGGGIPVTRLFLGVSGNNGVGNFSAPTISWAVGDVDTGLDQVSDGVLEMLSNGISRIHLNAGAGNMGFGDNTDPAVDFEFEDASDPIIRITDGRTDYGSASGVILGRYQWWSNDASAGGGNGGLVGSIHVESVNTTVFPDTQMNFTTYTDGSLAGEMHLTNAGSTLNTTGTFTSISSDGRLKENIVDANSQWDDIKNIRFVNYNLINNPELKQLGIITQELEQVCPELIINTQRSEEVNGELIENIKTFKQSIMYMKGMVALQEAMKRIEILEQKLIDNNIN